MMDRISTKNFFSLFPANYRPQWKVSTINLLTANPTNCLRVFDHVVGLELKRLRQNWTKRLFLTTTIHFLRLQPEFLKVLDFAETKFCINTKFSIYLVFVSLTSYSNINTSKSQVLNKKSITIRYN